MEKEVYFKTPLTIDDQLEKLRRRGLNIDDYDVARDFFSKVSYYRLRAYTYPFQDNNDPSADHKFTRQDINFTDFIKLYRFDEELRQLLFKIIGKVEIAVRTRITQTYAEATEDGHWFTDKDLFHDKISFDKEGKKKIVSFESLLFEITKDIHQSNESFISHYFHKYNSPSLQPSWMTLEVITFGKLSRLYQLLQKNDLKKQIAKDFSIPDVGVLENWLHTFTVWRNYCAHHCRIWNRRSISNICLRYFPNKPFLPKELIKEINNNKIFAVLCCLKYLLISIEPSYDVKGELLSIIKLGGKLLDLRSMGFPDNWEDYDPWKD